MRVSQWKTKLLLTAGYLLLVGVLGALQVPCLFQSVLHIPCPGCGMTRAILSLLRGNVMAAFSYHPMVWSVPVLYAYFWLDNGLFRSKAWNTVLVAGIFAGFAITWLWRLVEIAL